MKKLSHRFILAMIAFAIPLIVNAQNRSELERYPLIETTSNLARGKSIHLNLDRSRYVQKLKLSAFGRGDEAMFEVVVNGEVKGTIHVPGRDPEYIVTVADVTETITLRHKTGATVAILALNAYVMEQRFPGPFPPSESTRGIAARMSLGIINNIKDFEGYASAGDIELYLHPVKVWAGRAYASASASGDLSARVRQRLTMLILKMNDAESFVNSALDNEETFYLAVQFLSLKEELEGYMD